MGTEQTQVEVQTDGVRSAEWYVGRLIGAMEMMAWQLKQRRDDEQLRMMGERAWEIVLPFLPPRAEAPNLGSPEGALRGRRKT
jgi:hypothetical protein